MLAAKGAGWELCVAAVQDFAGRPGLSAGAPAPQCSKQQRFDGCWVAALWLKEHVLRRPTQAACGPAATHARMHHLQLILTPPPPPLTHPTPPHLTNPPADAPHPYSPHPPTHQPTLSHTNLVVAAVLGKGRVVDKAHRPLPVELHLVPLEHAHQAHVVEQEPGRSGRSRLVSAPRGWSRGRACAHLQMLPPVRPPHFTLSDQKLSPRQLKTPTHPPTHHPLTHPPTHQPTHPNPPTHTPKHTTPTHLMRVGKPSKPSTWAVQRGTLTTMTSCEWGLGGRRLPCRASIGSVSGLLKLRWNA